MTAQPYPPLPKVTDFGFRDESGLWNMQDGFTHDQMREYVDADRAQREQAQPEPGRKPTEAEIIISAITNPDNQPSQWGTVLLPEVALESVNARIQKAVDDNFGRCPNEDWFTALTDRRDELEAQIKALRVLDAKPGDGNKLSKALWLAVQNCVFAQCGDVVRTDTAAMKEMRALIDHVCIGIDSPAAPQAQPAQAGIPAPHQNTPVWVGAKNGVLGGWAFPTSQPERKPPEWHDAPTVPGLWVNNMNNLVSALEDEIIIEHLTKHPVPGKRWYGPIPQEPAP